MANCTVPSLFKHNYCRQRSLQTYRLIFSGNHIFQPLHDQTANTMSLIIFSHKDPSNMVALKTAGTNHTLPILKDINAFLFKITFQILPAMLLAKEPYHFLRIVLWINFLNRILNKIIEFFHIINCRFCILQFNTSYTISIWDKLLFSWGRGFFRKNPVPNYN